MKREIKIFDYASEIMKSLEKGVLLTTKSNNKVNTMAISWGCLGIEWKKPIFTVFVRENRFTKKQLEENPEFTINIPIGEFNKNIISFCGRKSGYSIDKIKELNLSLINPSVISVPAIKELPLTLECRVIYKQKQDKNEISTENKSIFYPQDVESSFYGCNKDFHIAYYGEIVKAYIIE